MGGFGIVPTELDGAIVSGHYFLYEIDKAQVAQISWVLPDGLVIPEQDVQQFVKGSVNYAAIRSQHFLELEIPFPPFEDQHGLLIKSRCCQIKSYNWSH